MKNIYKLLAPLTIVLLLAVVAGCEDDAFEFPASEPLIFSNSGTLSTLPGGSISISASITDPVGLQSVLTTYEPWSLADAVSLNGEAEYDYSLTVEVPANAEMGSSHELTISAVNVNGIEKSATVSITLDEDANSPTITINTPPGIAFLQDGDDVTIDISVSDDVSIASFTITGTNVTEKITVGANKYNYSRALNIQQEGVYEYDIEVVDEGGNMASTTISIPAFEPFDNIYIADVDNDADLVNDLMGVPMLIDGFDVGDSLGKVFVANYYNASANTEVRFLSSKESFSPLSIGSSSEAGVLAASGNASVDPIVLSQVGYNRISIDLRDFSYSVETYEPADTVYQYTIFMGTGVRVNGESTCTNNADGSDGACWWFGSGKELTPDDNNPYLFHAQVELFDYDPDDTENLGFILGANLAGWSDFWRFDSDAGPDRTVLNGGSNFLFGPDQFGTYTVSFDTHLNQLTMIKN